MFMDKTLEFALNAAIPATGGIIGQIVEMDKQELYKQPFIVVRVGDTACVGGTSIGVSITSSDTTTPDGTALVSPQTDLVLPAVLAANLNKGDLIATIRLPFGMKKFVALTAQVSGSFSAGTLNADITWDIMKQTPLEAALR
jgi:hypothetical protein